MDILAQYSREQLKDFLDLDKKIDWLDDFYEWITQQMAYDVFENWAINHDDQDYYELANNILDQTLESNK